MLTLLPLVCEKFAEIIEVKDIYVRYGMSIHGIFKYINVDMQ